MLVPSIFSNSLFDDIDFFSDPSWGFGYRDAGLMNTDIKDTEAGYELTMNMPGVKKEDVKAELKDGYLTISTSSDSSKDEKDEDGTYICRERYSGSCQRSFYVGEDIKQEDIKATFENGTLKMLIPKTEVKSKEPEQSFIKIAG